MTQRPHRSVGIALPLALAACAPAPTRPPLAPEAVEALAERADAAAQRLAETLQPELKAAIGKGGPENAVDVCGDIAKRITAEVAASDGVTLRRVALRLRNPENAPDATERAVLERWERGETFSWHEVVDLPDGREFRWMREIRLGDVCLQCHGPADRISEATRRALAVRYPEDRATGFADGDLRGAFSVRIRVAE